MTTIEKQIILNSQAAQVVGLNVGAPSYFDVEIENDFQKIVQRQPSNFLASASDIGVIEGAMPVCFDANGQPLKFRVFARGANVIDQNTDIVLIMKK